MASCSATYLIFSFFLCSFLVFNPPNVGITSLPPQTYNPNVHGSDACRRSHKLWARTLDKSTRVGLLKAVDFILIYKQKILEGLKMFLERIQSYLVTDLNLTKQE